MPVRVLVGDMFESDAQTLVNTVNCVGVMGKGVALQFKKRFPENFRDYAERCERGQVKLGRPYLFRPHDGPWIINFPTKDHWRSITRLEDITEGLDYLLSQYQEWGIESIAVPPLGCGHGQLEWAVVGPTLFHYLSRMDIPVELYAPYGTSTSQLQPEFLDRRRGSSKHGSQEKVGRWVKPAHVAIVEIVNRITAQPGHWPVGRTMFQKIVYVATRLGLPTGLEYRKGTYGPFADGLKRLQGRLISNGLLTEERQGRMIRVGAGPTLADARRSFADELVKWDDILNRVVELFSRSTTDEAERAGSIMFAADQLREELGRRPKETEVLDYVLDWKKGRKPTLDAPQLSQAIRTLGALRWVDLGHSPELDSPEEKMVPSPLSP